MHDVKNHRWVLILIAAAAAACGSGAGTENNVVPESKDAVQPAPAKVTGNEPANIEVLPGELIGSWTLVAIDDAPVTKVGATPTLEILEDGSVAGVGGVNRFHAQLGIVDGRLSFGPAAATKMAGPPEAMDLESTYLTRLAAVSTFDIDGETLRLAACDNEALTFVRTGE